MSENVDNIKSMLKKFRNYYNRNYKEIEIAIEERNRKNDLIKKLENKIEKLKQRNK